MDCVFHFYPHVDGLVHHKNVAQDINYVFKFHVGDKVIKKWNWSKTQNSRFSSSLKTLKAFCGIIHCILPNGEICVAIEGTDPSLFAPYEGGDKTHWHFGASELDFA